MKPAPRAPALYFCLFLTVIFMTYSLMFWNFPVLWIKLFSYSRLCVFPKSENLYKFCNILNTTFKNITFLIFFFPLKSFNPHKLLWNKWHIKEVLEQRVCGLRYSFSETVLRMDSNLFSKYPCKQTVYWT